MIEPKFLLDSNICIYVLRDADGVSAKRVGAAAQGSVVTSIIVYAEVLRGIARRERDSIASAVRFFETVRPMPFDQAAADMYAGLPFRRAKFDRLIAAHALSRGLTLVTNNERDFADIPGLRIENWTL